MTATLDRAYAACDALASSHYENFPVASRLLPAAMRRHVAAVYAYARVADDIADEGGDPPDARRARLGAWQKRLHDVVDRAGEPAGESRDDLIVAAVGQSMRECDLPLQLFDDLLSAFAQDITTSEYDSWADLLDYCRRSANPVGRLVLRIGGYHGEALERSSDALCTALQLANFWQDFGRDWRTGRVYVPREVWQGTGASRADLERGTMTPPWVAALTQCVARTRACFERGRLVCDSVGGRLSLELRLTWLGGSRILDRVERGAAALLTDRPTLGARDLPALLWRAVRWERQAA